METILLVYNANSGFWHKSLDFAHKIISPSTYACDLCKLTHGDFAERETWKKIKNDFPGRFQILYKDQYEEVYGSQKKVKTFPVVLKEYQNTLEILITADQISKLQSIEALVSLIQNSLIKSL